MTLDERRAGLSIHPTSLPAAGGLGDLGAASLRWLDALAASGASLWQVLPLLAPDGYGSPYQPRSAFALDPLLCAPDNLVAAGWLEPDELPRAPVRGRIDRQAARAAREPLYRTAFERARGEAEPELLRFQSAAPWCPDWALFAAIEREAGGRPWWRWPPALAERDPAALAAARERLAGEILYHVFVQWCLDAQWKRVRERAHALGLRILGDLPMFVGRHSDLAWTRPEACGLDRGHARALAGVPATRAEPAQRWGLPLWDWEWARRDGFVLHRRRFERALQLFDLLRLDHFGAYARAWAVPGDDAEGRWFEGPGDSLFDALEAGATRLPAVVEDVGVVPQAALDLRDRRGYASTRVLQNGFGDGDGDGDSTQRPDDVPENAAFHTSTHDTDTWLGWWRHRAPREGVRATLNRPQTPPRELGIQAVWHSRARLAMAPVQDLCGLSSRARMNRPGTAGGNWRWRLRPELLCEARLGWLRALTERTGRLG